MGECIEDKVIGLFQRTLSQHATPKLVFFVSAECDGSHRLSTPSLGVPNVFVWMLVLNYGHALRHLGKRWRDRSQAAFQDFHFSVTSFGHNLDTAAHNESIQPFTGVSGKAMRNGMHLSTVTPVTPVTLSQTVGALVRPNMRKPKAPGFCTNLAESCGSCGFLHFRSGEDPEGLLWLYLVYLVYFFWIETSLNWKTSLMRTVTKWMGSGPGPPDGRSFHPFHCAQDQILHAQPPFISTALVCMKWQEFALHSVQRQKMRDGCVWKWCWIPIKWPFNGKHDDKPWNFGVPVFQTNLDNNRSLVFRPRFVLQRDVCTVQGTVEASRGIFKRWSSQWLWLKMLPKVTQIENCWNYVVKPNIFNSRFLIANGLDWWRNLEDPNFFGFSSCSAVSSLLSKACRHQ